MDSIELGVELLDIGKAPEIILLKTASEFLIVVKVFYCRHSLFDFLAPSCWLFEPLLEQPCPNLGLALVEKTV